MLAFWAAHWQDRKPVRRQRNVVHITSPEPLGKRAKRRARGKSKARK
jgi:hypothetical protein